MKKGILITLLSALAGGLTAYAVVHGVAPQQILENRQASTDAAMFRTVNLSNDNWPDFTYAAESAVDAVVYVKVTSTQTMQQSPGSIFDFFFGLPQQGAPQQREKVGSGSGVIIREDGYIVTNNHVIDGATKIEVTLNNNQKYPATLVGTDPATDVALLKIDATGLPVVPFGDSDKLRLGEWVLAIGSPYDLRSTITAGIVSAKGRSMPNYTGEFKIESFIQTDAAVNPGNSGGALVDKAGNLVGINTAIISQTGSYTGYSFAVPVNIVPYDSDHGFIARRESADRFLNGSCIRNHGRINGDQDISGLDSGSICCSTFRNLNNIYAVSGRKFQFLSNFIINFLHCYSKNCSLHLTIVHQVVNYLFNYVNRNSKRVSGIRTRLRNYGSIYTHEIAGFIH